MRHQLLSIAAALTLAASAAAQQGSEPWKGKNLQYFPADIAREVHAVDYLLKPFTAERFRTALSRARERIARRAEDRGLANLATSLRNRPAYLTRVPVRTGGRMVFVDLDAVDWLEAADNDVRLHVKQHEYLVREPLGTLEARLDPDRFARIHRRAIVQLDRVTEWRSTSHGDAALLLRDGTRLAVSRTFRDRLQRVLRQA